METPRWRRRREQLPAFPRIFALVVSFQEQTNTFAPTTALKQRPRPQRREIILAAPSSKKSSTESSGAGASESVAVDSYVDRV